MVLWTDESILGEQLSIYCYCDLIFYWKTMETAILQEYLIYNCFCCFDCFDYFHPTLQQRLFVWFVFIFERSGKSKWWIHWVSNAEFLAIFDAIHRNSKLCDNLLVWEVHCNFVYKIKEELYWEKVIFKIIC